LNLHDLIARYGPQPEARVVHILAEICASLTEAHALGLIHRDIKPGNIFLCRRGGLADCVKVLDFGLVRDISADQPEPADAGRPHVIEGTPWFTPPEAIQSSGHIDPRSDLYALGALGYYLLTGRYIFDAENVKEIHAQQLTGVPVPPRQRTTNHISSALEEILLGCLEKDQDLRPASAGELRTRLLALPTAVEWTPELRLAWWVAYDAQPVAEPDATGAVPSTPMATVRIDLAGRME